jgi:hypothetical protein
MTYYVFGGALITAFGLECFINSGKSDLTKAAKGYDH